MIVFIAWIIFLVSGFFSISIWIYLVGDILRSEFTAFKSKDNWIQIPIITILFLSSGVYLFGFW